MFERIIRVFKDDVSTPLKVQSVDLCRAKNGEAHHTEEYDVMEKPMTEGGRLVVRRGQQFKIKIKFDREYQPDEDMISFVFTYKNALKPSYGNGTQVAVPLLKADETTPTQWSATRIKIRDEKLTVSIFAPATSIVGQWEMDIDTKLEDREQSMNYDLSSPFYLLFNPWCQDDACYMSGESQRKEYVLNDSGVIWRGAHNFLEPKAWIYGQFEENILDCSLYVLNSISRLRPKQMGDPVEVCRAISSGVNSADNNGVLTGNWGEVTDGTSPLKWVGSVKILQTFFKTKESVRYGQCWVFSGILTTMCRALGIPARPITNFSSAHDTQESLTIDYFFNDEGEPEEDLNDDSIWNFHVWVEAWMSRPDLEPGDYSGWQAIDATPQETSQGLYRCGPASLKAIRRGEIKKPYDVTFLYSEVNADEVYWKYTGSGKPLKLVGKETQKVGKYISTKAVGSNEREDVTHLYKAEEGGTLERDVNLRALEQSQSVFSRCYKNEYRTDIEFKLEEMDIVEMGHPFTVKLHIENKNPHKEHHVSGVLRVSSIIYTGRHKGPITYNKFEETLSPNSKKTVTLTVSAEKYSPHIKDSGALSMSALAKVANTDCEFFARDDFKIGKLGLQIETEGPLKAGERFVVRAKFYNSLNVPLTGGQFEFEASGIFGEEETKACQSEVQPGEEATAFCIMKARIRGSKKIGVVFNCDQMEPLDGQIDLEIASRFD